MLVFKNYYCSFNGDGYPSSFSGRLAVLFANSDLRIEVFLREPFINKGLNDSFKTIDDIRDFIASERDAMSEADRSLMTVNLRVDEDVRMGIVSDVKQELRRCSALKIMYASRKPGVE